MRDEEQKKEYELAYLAKTEEDAKGVLEMLKSQGMEITVESPINKIPLAYKVEKETAAFFGYVQFSARPETIKPIEDALNIKSGILRHLIITPPYMKNRPHSAAPYGKSRPQKPVPEAKREPVAAEPLSNEALEKKIEEILNK